MIGAAGPTGADGPGGAGDAGDMASVTGATDATGPGGAGSVIGMSGPAGAGGSDGAASVIRVLIADDQALVRGSFRVLVETEPGFAVVGEASTGAEAVEVARRERPDVVLMDVRMPDLNGIEATRQLCRAGPDRPARASPGGVRVLILTTFDLDEYVYAALQAGASGFLLKDTPPRDLLTAIRIVAGGEALLAPSVTRRLIAEFTRRPGLRPAPVLADTLAGVTEREREVLTLVARGLSNAEIMQTLHLSAATVKTHIGRLLAKLDARDRAQLVIIAYESGLVSPNA